MDTPVFSHLGMIYYPLFTLLDSICKHFKRKFASVFMQDVASFPITSVSGFGIRVMLAFRSSCSVLLKFLEECVWSWHYLFFKYLVEFPMKPSGCAVFFLGVFLTEIQFL